MIPKDIKEILFLSAKTNPHILEIGCGNGRDAYEIVKHTNDYLGIDISEKLINLAYKKVPGAHFEVADIEDFVFPHDLDIIFAFASLIHVPKDSLKTILEKSHVALHKDGFFRISIKYADHYQEITKEDEFGIRTYYLYSLEDIQKLSKGYLIVKDEIEEKIGQKWLEVILKRR